MDIKSSEILQSFSDEIENVAAKAGRSVVSVATESSSGSGIAWTENHVVTAFHVVNGSNEISVSTSTAELSGRVIGRDAMSDIAVVKVDGKLLPSDGGDNGKARVGQFVLAVARPYSSGIVATSGIVTGAGLNMWTLRELRLDDAIISDTRVNPGYSGGPLVNASGRIIGMNIAYASSRCISIPSGRIAKTAERLISGRQPERPHLGVAFRPIELPKTALGVRYGLIIMSVEEESPAEKAGITIGDVIMSVDGRSVSDIIQSGRILDEDSIGKKIALGILRSGKAAEVEIVPEGLKEEC